MADRGKISKDNKPRYDAMMEQLKTEGWQPSKNTPKAGAGGGRNLPPRSAAPKQGEMGVDIDNYASKQTTRRPREVGCIDSTKLLRHKTTLHH